MLENKEVIHSTKEEIFLVANKLFTDECTEYKMSLQYQYKMKKIETELFQFYQFK